MKNQFEAPDHYTHGEREAVEYMRDLGVLEKYIVGNMIKYIYRYRHKGDALGDAKKIVAYAKMLVELLERENKGAD